MRRVNAVMALSALVIAFFAGAVACAGEPFSLDRNASAPTLTLGLSGGADTVPVHGWRSWYRPYYRPYAYSSFHGYPRAYSYYYPSYYYPPAYRSYYAPALSLGFSYGYYRPSYYAAPVYYPWCPIGLTLGSASASLGSTVLRITPAAPSSRPEMTPPPRPWQGDSIGPAPALPPGERTFPYDGGPQNPVPMPKAEPNPTGVPALTVPLEGRVVGLPGKAAGKYTYPAYGEQYLLRQTLIPDRTLLTGSPVPVIIGR